LRRLCLPLLAVCALAALPATGEAATKVSYPFAFGTYKGGFNGGGAVKIRLRKSTCFIRRQVTTPVKGACMRIFTFSAPSAPCPDGSKVDPVLGAYLLEGEEIHLAKSGSYHDVSQESISGGTVTARTTLTLKAKGRKVTGTVKVEGSESSNTSVQCAAATASFTAST
jgi:hypothetical protein